MTDNTVDKKEEIKKDGYSYEEIHSADLATPLDTSKDKQAGAGKQEDNKDNKSGADTADTTKDKQPADVDTTKDTTVDTKDKGSDKQTPTKPDIDVEKVISQTAAQTAAEIAKSLVDKSATKEQKDELEEKLEGELSKQKWIKENRNPTYTEMAKFMTKITKDVAVQEAVKQVKADLQKEVEDEDAKEKVQKDTQASQDKVYHAKWDAQLAQLESQNLIPKGEEGKEARTKLFELMRGLIMNGKPTDNLVEVYYMHYKPAIDQLAKQKNSPVAGNQRGGSSSSGDVIDYNDIHNNDATKFIKEMRQG